MAFIEGNAVTGARTTRRLGLRRPAAAAAEFRASSRRGGAGGPRARRDAGRAERAGLAAAASRPMARSPRSIMNKGEILWQVAHGETPDDIRNHPVLKGLTIPRTGQPGYASARW